MSAIVTPLLSIAIPTYNRDVILDEALSKLLPQINEQRKVIEFIISDNASNDTTQKIIKNHKEKYPGINFVSNLQPVNTGYYGNFKKCKQLSTGKYFWLLSDNEFVGNDIIVFVIDILNRQNEVSAIYLSDWGVFEDKVEGKGNYQIKVVNLNDLFFIAGYKLTSTSAVIFKNTKEKDDEVFEIFNGNLFLGFGLFLESLSQKNDAIIVNGISLWSKYAQIHFNVFEAFTIHLDLCMSYGLANGKITEEISNNFVNNIIRNLTRWHYLKYKLQIDNYNMDMGSIFEINNLLKKYLRNYSGFQRNLYPLIISPRGLLFIWYYSYKIIKYLIKKINYYMLKYLIKN